MNAYYLEYTDEDFFKSDIELGGRITSLALHMLLEPMIVIAQSIERGKLFFNT